MKTATPPAEPAAMIETALPHSRFLQRLLGARPALREALHASLATALDAAALERLLGPAALDEDTLKPALRALRAHAFAHVAIRDLCGSATLAEVTGTMTALAEVAVARALAVLHPQLAARHGEPLDARGRGQRLAVIGMGKLGGHELNVSSDIDLIFAYPEEGETAGPAVLSNHEFFTRLGKRLIDALAGITADGQVFRVDMRLRPNGDSGPLVGSFDMFETYFVTQGREWERYAWIKARAIAGERIDELAEIATPFVYRKYLDFGAFHAMRELHAQIRREVARRDMADNVKLGPGGIREIEFIAQVFQLIRGGREAALRIRPTLAVLRRLAKRGTLSAHTVDELSAAYDFLRRLEHRLQYVEDQQTHELPAASTDRALIARAMGYHDWAGLAAALAAHRAVVSRSFEQIFSDPNGTSHPLTGLWQSARDGEATAAELSRLGYAAPADSAQRLAATRSGQRYQQMPAASRAQLDALLPRVIEAAAETPDPDATLTRVLGLLDAVSGRAAYLALLLQYPQALRRVAQVMSASSWAAEFLTRHPLLLDELLDARALDQTPDWPAWRAELGAALDEQSEDTERQMDLMREAHHAQVFRLLNQDLAGALTVERLADHLSALADAVLDITISTTWSKMARRHREVPRFAVIGYGKLGGKELGYASDLDIIFLYDDEDDEAPALYARLAQRIISWIASQTAAGALYEIDTRLRPNGESGLLVSSIAAFEKYQLESAWVWEHQALTRARYCAGDARLGQAFETIRTSVLRQRRELADLRREVLAMRARMAQAHANKSDAFDLKHDAGGLIDVEFIVQYLVLGHAHRHAQLVGNLGNIALLGIAAELGLIPAAQADAARAAYREYRRRQHALRLNGAPHARVDAAGVATHIAAVRDLWSTVFCVTEAGDIAKA